MGVSMSRITDAQAAHLTTGVDQEHDSVRAISWPVRRLNLLVNGVVGVALAAELAMLFGSMVARGLFNAPIIWAEEASVLALGVLAFIGGAAAYPRGQHSAVLLAVDRLPAAWKTPLAALVNWLVFGQSVIIGVVSVPVLLQRRMMYTPILGIQAAWILLPLTIGMVLLAIYALEWLWYCPRRTAAATGGVLLVVAVAALLARPIWTPWMQGSVVLWFSLAAATLMVLIGVPIGFVLAGTSQIYLFISNRAPLVAVPLNMQQGTSGFVLLAIPFFVLVGLIMDKGGISVRLVDFVRALAGHMRGGLLQAEILSMYLFSGISGSKAADITAVGSVMIGALRREGYNPGESVAVLAASAAMGETVPPSIAMLLLGSVASLSVGALFMAGLLPAVLVALCLMIVVYVKARRRGMRPHGRFSLRELTRSLGRSFLALLMPIALLGGIVAGIATPTEIASAAVVYGLVLAMLMYREMNLRDFWGALTDSASLAGMILFIMSTASAFSWCITVDNLPKHIAAFMVQLGGGATLFLLLTVVVLVIMGAVLEGLPALLVFGPLLLPVAVSLGINEIHFGIVLILAMGIGAFSPPLGVGLYIACAVGGTTMKEATREMGWYIVALLVGLLIVTFVPWITLALPHALQMGG